MVRGAGFPACLNVDIPPTCPPTRKERRTVSTVTDHAMGWQRPLYQARQKQTAGNARRFPSLGRTPLRYSSRLWSQWLQHATAM